jgi:DNA-binding XRE family transcriptional regulator
MASLPRWWRCSAEMLDDRRLAGWSVRQAAWRLGVSIREYRELEAGTRSPSFETWDRICKMFGWPQTVAGALVNPRSAIDR